MTKLLAAITLVLTFPMTAGAQGFVGAGTIDKNSVTGHRTAILRILALGQHSITVASVDGGTTKYQAEVPFVAPSGSVLDGSGSLTIVRDVPADQPDWIGLKTINFHENNENFTDDLSVIVHVHPGEQLPPVDPNQL